jgi:hypothetical protein
MVRLLLATITGAGVAAAVFAGFAMYTWTRVAGRTPPAAQVPRVLRAALRALAGHELTWPWFNELKTRVPMK